MTVATKSYRLNRENMLSVLTAGKAEFSLQNEESKKHFTYVLVKAKSDSGVKQNQEGKQVYFVKVCRDYMEFQYAGVLIIEQEQGAKYFRGRKGKINPDAESIKGLLWLINKLLRGQEIPEVMQVYHFGKCCRCGRTLTDPESVKLGVGPECIKLIG